MRTEAEETRWMTARMLACDAPFCGQDAPESLFLKLKGARGEEFWSQPRRRGLSPTREEARAEGSWKNFLKKNLLRKDLSLLVSPLRFPQRAADSLIIGGTDN